MSFHIQIAKSENASEIAKVHLSSKKLAEKNIVDAAYLDSLSVSAFEQNWKEWLAAEETQVFIAWDGHIPAGFISIGPLRTPPPGTSKIRPLYVREIYALYVSPDYFRQGVGLALVRHAAAALIEQGQKSLCLWVLEKNTRAKAFYDSLGGQRLGKMMVEMGRTKVKEICYGWRDISEIVQK
jgi:ribosomal protein S18 acetylase RimI-like enzyme